MHLVLYPIKQPRLEPYTSTQNPQKRGIPLFYVQRTQHLLIEHILMYILSLLLQCHVNRWVAFF